MVLCTWAVWPSEEDVTKISDTIKALSLATFWPYLAGFIALTAVTHFFRAWRWNNLLRPIEAELPAGKLLAYSSVGFMFILMLPFRLGEFVRPALVREKGRVSAAAVLGTVVVERIIDGLFVSLIVFVAFFMERDSPTMSSELMFAAYLALGLFAAALSFLIFALRWPDTTVRFALRVSLLPRISAGVASVVEEKLHSLIRGFHILRDKTNFLAFMIWTGLYWVANGLSLLVLANGFGFDMTAWSAIAVTSWVAIGLSLPNAPGLIGQYHWLMTAGMALYIADTAGALSFALVIWALQVAWYIVAGLVAFLTPYVSYRDIVATRHNVGSDSPPD